MARELRFDTRGVQQILNDLLDTAKALDGRHEVDPDFGPGRRNDPSAAQLSRDLLRAAELSRLAAAEFGQLYWRLKGHPDPRDTVSQPRQEGK